MLAQRFTLNPLGSNEVCCVCFSYFVDGDDVRMVQRQSRTRFLLKSAHAVITLGEIVRQEFQGDLAMRSRVRGKIYLAHSAGAEGPDNLIVTNRLSDD